MPSLKCSPVFALLFLSAGGCEDRSTKVFDLDGVTYAVPTEHIASSNREKHTFIRIKSPDKVYDLVHDSREPGAQHGPGVPKIFSVNDEDQSGVDYYKGPSGTIACREAVHPKSGCGLRVSHKGVEWTVLFPIARLSEAPGFERDALTVLERYAD